MNPTLAGPDPKEQTFGQILGRIVDAYKRAPRLKPIDADDPLVIDRVRHTMRKGEKMMSWYARTGIGKTQAMTMSRAEITRFVQQAETNRTQEPLPPPELMEPRRIPARITLIDTDAL